MPAVCAVPPLFCKQEPFGWRPSYTLAVRLSCIVMTLGHKGTSHKRGYNYPPQNTQDCYSDGQMERRLTAPCYSAHCSSTVKTSRLCSELWCCFNCLCFSIPSPGLGAGAQRRFWTAQLLQEGTFPRVAHTQSLLCSGQKVKKGSTHWARKILPLEPERRRRFSGRPEPQYLSFF